MKSKLIKKLCSCFLALSMLTSTGIGQVVGEFVGMSITVSAADTLTYGDYNYTVKSDNTVTIAKYVGLSTKTVIPSEIGGKKVTSIGNYAFRNCTGLTSITIPNSVTSIGDYAFYYCTGLTSITIPNSVTSIGYEAFYNCKNLISITIPNSVTSIGNYAFWGCNNLVSINVDTYNSAYSSENGILFNKNKSKIITCPECKKGTYTIPNSVTSIGNYAFRNCTGLTSINVDTDNSAYSSENGILFNKL